MSEDKTPIGNMDAFRELCKKLLNEPLAEDPTKTTLEDLVIRMIKSKNYRAHVEILSAAFGRIPNATQQIEQKTEVVFKVEHDASWVEMLSDDDGIVDGEFKEITDKGADDVLG